MKEKLILLLVSVCVTAGISAAEPPLMKDFIGLNGHFKFKPELYKQTCRLARNYHNINWDVNKPGDPITIPKCPNKVDWEKNVYGKWVKEGFEVDLCAQFGSFGESNKEYINLWKDQEDWINLYGYELAKYFGPSGNKKLVTSIEIGNEPGNDFDDTLYKSLFVNMAKGIRKGDPRLKIVTATAHSGKADKYSKSLEETFSSPEIKSLYDVINVHVYAIKPKKDGHSPWDRSYPEDPALEYLDVVDRAISFRDKQAKGKEVWVTEFGYDACTPGAMSKREGWAKKLNWQGVSDKQQAQYIVRSLFCFAERDISRAYIYFFNDEDKPSVHASSGLTRHFKPKPSFWAVKHLYETLGEYRFNRVVMQQKENIYVYEFKHGTDKNLAIWAAWSPTGKDREQVVTIRNPPGRLIDAESIPLTSEAATKVSCKNIGNVALKFKISESPVYIKFSK